MLESLSIFSNTIRILCVDSLCKGFFYVCFCCWFSRRFFCCFFLNVVNLIFVIINSSLLTFFVHFVRNIMILPPPTDIPLFLSLSLPEYRYVPKYLPHPFRSDKGHQHMRNIKSRLHNRNKKRYWIFFGCMVVIYFHIDTTGKHTSFGKRFGNTKKVHEKEIQAAIKCQHPF